MALQGKTILTASLVAVAAAILDRKPKDPRDESSSEWRPVLNVYVLRPAWYQHDRLTQIQLYLNFNAT